MLFVGQLEVACASWKARLFSKIEKALARMESGDYADCENCGDEIGERRLRARPVATYCIECKEDMEREESRRAEADAD